MTTKQSKNVTQHTNSLQNDIPAGDPPAPPGGYEPHALGGQYRGFRPDRAQRLHALVLAREVRSSPTYAHQFGEGVPDANALADALEVATSLSDRLAKAKLWLKYIDELEHSSWKHALTLSEQLRVPFLTVSSRKADILTSYPGASAFFGAALERARRARSARSRNRVANSKQGTEPTAASSAAPNAGGTKSGG
jgi:hypothetical protein